MLHSSSTPVIGDMRRYWKMYDCLTDIRVRIAYPPERRFSPAEEDAYYAQAVRFERPFVRMASSREGKGIASWLAAISRIMHALGNGPARAARL
ncbi:hypothetical protein VE25_00615 [Devosia geojensis]|uniref:Uncharacterized protein n=1 Tax=Devosia geojensis TaxID=443610 RepID=A0A0F5FZR6_9HYPH|nr:hypothetical protein [Devosia geojensis]KKB13687.1 hypothetical protein VE25_00615 [Devosia geojensis]